MAVPISSSTATTPLQDASGYGFAGPSFSYSNSNNPPSRSSQHSSSIPVMQSESPGYLASVQASVQAQIPGLSKGTAPFSYNVLHHSAGFSGNEQAVEQGHYAVGKSTSSLATSLQPALPSVTTHPGLFAPGTAAQVMARTGPLLVGAPEGNSLQVTNRSANGSLQPMQRDQSLTMNLRADATQESGAIASAPSLTQCVLQPALTYSSTSPTLFTDNNFSTLNTWLPPVPPFQLPPGMPRTPVTPGPPGIAPSVPSAPIMSARSSAVDSPTLPRLFMPNAPVQQQAFAPYPSPSPQAVPPGQWLQSQQISGMTRPPFSPYPGVITGPFPMPARAMLPFSVLLPNMLPPGVTPVASSAGNPVSSVTSDGQSTLSSMQSELPPGIDNSQHVSYTETEDGTSVKEQLDSWTVHRTESGILYYYNALTEQSTYEKPSGFEGKLDKATELPTSVLCEKFAGTDWMLVTTNDGKRYYYNSVTQLSSWQIPTEVAELKKKQDGDALKEQSVPVTTTNVLTELGPASVSLNIPAANTGGRDATPLRPSGVSGTSSALDLIKKKLQDSGTPATASSGPALSGTMTLDLNGSKPIEATVKGPQNDNGKDKCKDDNADGNLSDSSSDTEDEDNDRTKECIIQFKEMLKERGVAPFSKWEKELPKIVFDPRFKAIPNHSARRSLFEHYVRTRAEEERKEKRAAQKAAVESFKQLMDEAKEDIDHSTNYETFKRKWGHDPRFEALDRKERESLLNERLFPLKRAAEEKAQAERASAISNFKAMLQDKGNITSNSRWSKVKESLRSDPRYKSVKHEVREGLFNEYIAELKAADEEIERKVKAIQVEEDKLRERERALRKRKEREEQEVERARLKAHRKEAVESYQALLVETIKDPQASWTESKPKLDKDPQGRTDNPRLDQSDLEKLFREHVKTLHERCVLEFIALLAEFITVEAASRETDGKTILTSWSTAKKLLKADPRYNKMPRKDRESLWRRHAEDVRRKHKLAHDPGAEKHSEARSRGSVDSGKYTTGSKRTRDRR